MYTIDLDASDLDRESTNTRIDKTIETLRRDRDTNDVVTLRSNAESTESVYRKNENRQAVRFGEQTDRVDTWQPIKC